MTDPDTYYTAPPGKYLVDPYEEWAVAEGIPVARGRSIDLAAVATAPWPRLGAGGALCQVEGRCDYLAVHVLELEGGAATRWKRHLYEEVVYVLAGAGSTEVELAPGQTRELAWRPGSLVSVPMNARHRHAAGTAGPARLVAFNDLRYLLGLYRNMAFLTETPLAFPERADDLAVVLGLPGRPIEGPDASLSLGSIGVDLIELAPGTYSPQRRQTMGAHVLCLAGVGFLRSTGDGRDNAVRTELRPGRVVGAQGMLFHQLFNTGPAPLRIARIELGSRQQPMFRPRRAAYGDSTVYAAGSMEIPAAALEREVHAAWAAEIAAKGIAPRMGPAS